MLVLEGEGDFVGGDGAFSEDHPGTAPAGEVDDGRRDGAGGGAAVDDEGNLVAKLGADELGVGTLGHAAQVGGRGGDGDAEAGYDCSGYGGFRNAEGDVASVGGNAQGKARAGPDDDGEWAGPEAFGKAIEGSVDIAGEAIGLSGLGQKERERFVPGAGLDLVDTIDCAEIYRVDGEAVEGVGGQGGYIAGGETFDHISDERGFRFVRVNAECLGRQKSSPAG
jgi:hypothetical protein